MGRLKGSKDLKPRKKRVDKKKKSTVKTLRKKSYHSKVKKIEPIHTTNKDVKYSSVKRDDNWYNDEYDNWLINVWIVGILTSIVFLTIMGLIIFNFM